MDSFAPICMKHIIFAEVMKFAHALLTIFRGELHLRMLLKLIGCDDLLIE